MPPCSPPRPTGTTATPIRSVGSSFPRPPEERRARLFPFLWGTLVPQGEIYGDLDAGSDAHVTNGFNFSYPGYSETLTGHGDPRIHSNDNMPNPNTTVLEFLEHQPGFEGRVAAFGAWEVIAGIVNAGRCGFPVNVAYDSLRLSPVHAHPRSPERHEDRIAQGLG